MEIYVPEDMRKKCLSALRWNRAQQNHRSKTIRLNHNVYVLLRQYARTKHITIQQAIYEAILPYVYMNPNADDNSPLHVTNEQTIKGSIPKPEANESDKPRFKITVF